jgi:hypothetical protein
LFRGVDVAVDLAPASAGRTAAGLLVAALAMTVAVLPAAVALGAAGVAGATVTAWLGGIAVVLGGVKLAAAAWGLLAWLFERPRLGSVAASID